MRLKRELLGFFAAGLGLSVGLNTWMRHREGSSLAQAKARFFRSIEKSAAPSDGLERALAQVGDSECLKDQLQPAALKLKVEQLELRYGGTPGPAQVGRVKLARVPQAQRDFLKIVADRAANSIEGKSFLLQLEGVDHSGCQSLVCLINRVYGMKETAEPGYLVYFYFLKMGAILNTGHPILNYPDDRYYSWGQPRTEAARLPKPPLESFLWSLEELRALWVFSNTFTAQAEWLPSLTRLYRMPRGAAIPSLRGGEGSALSTSRSIPVLRDGKRLGTDFQAGEIEFADIALRLGNPEFDLKEAFFRSLAHETAHHIDFSSAKSAPERITERAEWLALSGWRQVERVEQGRFTLTWVPESKRGFVSTYAATHPFEDFAETLAHVRYRGAQAFYDAPEKAKWVSEKYFQGRRFDEDGLIRFYVQSVADGLDRAFREALSHCDRLSGGADSEGGGAGFPIDLGSQLSTDQQECLKNALAAEFEKQERWLRKTEWEACRVFDSQRSRIRHEAIQEVSPRIGGILGTDVASEDREAMMEASRVFLKTLKNKLDPRELWLRCQSQSDREGCFERKLSEAFDQAARPHAAQLGSQLEEVKNQYLLDNAYAKTEDRARRLLDKLTATSDFVVPFAEQRWRECRGAWTLGQSRAEGVPLTQPFTGGTVYVSAPVLNCLNSQAAADASSLLQQWISGQETVAVADLAAQAYIRENLYGRYLARLQGLAETTAAAEELERNRWRAEALPALRKKGRVASGAEQCRAAAAQEFDLWLEARCRGVQAQGGIPPWTLTPLEPIRSAWSREACGP